MNRALDLADFGNEAESVIVLSWICDWTSLLCNLNSSTDFSKGVEIMDTRNVASD
jgi:hypothetical protein